LYKKTKECSFVKYNALYSVLQLLDIKFISRYSINEFAQFSVIYTVMPLCLVIENCSCHLWWINTAESGLLNFHFCRLFHVELIFFWPVQVVAIQGTNKICFWQILFNVFYLIVLVL